MSINIYVLSDARSLLLKYGFVPRGRVGKIKPRFFSDSKYEIFQATRWEPNAGFEERQQNPAMRTNMQILDKLERHYELADLINNEAYFRGAQVHGYRDGQMIRGYRKFTENPTHELLLHPNQKEIRLHGNTNDSLIERIFFTYQLNSPRKRPLLLVETQ